MEEELGTPGIGAESKNGMYIAMAVKKYKEFLQLLGANILDDGDKKYTHEHVCTSFSIAYTLYIGIYQNKFDNRVNSYTRCWKDPNYRKSKSYMGMALDEDIILIALSLNDRKTEAEIYEYETMLMFLTLYLERSKLVRTWNFRFSCAETKDKMLSQFETRQEAAALFYHVMTNATHGCILSSNDGINVQSTIIPHLGAYNAEKLAEIPSSSSSSLSSADVEELFKHPSAIELSKEILPVGVYEGSQIPTPMMHFHWHSDRTLIILSDWNLKEFKDDLESSNDCGILINRPNGNRKHKEVVDGINNWFATDQVKCLNNSVRYDFSLDNHAINQTTANQFTKEIYESRNIAITTVKEKFVVIFEIACPFDRDDAARSFLKKAYPYKYQYDIYMNEIDHHGRKYTWFDEMGFNKLFKREAIHQYLIAINGHLVTSSNDKFNFQFVKGTKKPFTGSKFRKNVNNSGNSSKNVNTIDLT